MLYSNFALGTKILSGLLLAALLWFTCANCRTIRRSSESRPITHEQWDVLLKKHVKNHGAVDYAAFTKDKPALEKYLNHLESVHPNEQHWSRAEQMAYWINAYNAYTIKIMVDNWPVESIKDIKRGIPFVNTVWDIKFIKIQGHSYDLNNIEHNILRPIFRDARVHAAVNCASYSCPALQPYAYTAADLDGQLDQAMRDFVNDPMRNRIRAEKAEISEIFKWFSGDFKEKSLSVVDFINQYARNPIGAETKLEYLNYDWRANSMENFRE